jgi:hypothetical protein
LIVTGLQSSSTGLSAALEDQGATATVITVAYNDDWGMLASTVHLIIPSLGVNQTFTSPMVFGTDGYGHVTDGQSYAQWGAWSNRANQPPNSGTLPSPAAFVFGYETPQSAMPASGSAVFSGERGDVRASIYKPVNGEIQYASTSGTPSIFVNFGSGAIAGNFTQMSAANGPWNDVAFSGNIATGTNKFSGPTNAASSPGGPMSLSASATGHIDGAFYGPAAQSLGAVWSLSDGTGSAIGTVVAGH